MIIQCQSLQSVVRVCLDRRAATMTLCPQLIEKKKSIRVILLKCGRKILYRSFICNYSEYIFCSHFFVALLFWNQI